MRIFHGDFYEVTDEGEGQPVVSFQSLKREKGLEQRSFFGRKFLLESGFRAICVKSARNCWYQLPEFDGALDAIRGALGEERPITYGASMGGFAAWFFAHELNAQRFIAFSPQFHLDPAQTPFETRWRQHVAFIERNATWRPLPGGRPSGVVCHDPSFEPDEAHARLIAERTDCTMNNYTGHGHNVLRHFRNAGTLKEEMTAVLMG